MNPFEVQEFNNIQQLIPESYLKKRRAVEFILTLILSPFLLFLILIVSLTLTLFDKGPVFFIQNRMGKRGKLFRMYKFRTMYQNCDDRFLTSTNDKRVTKIGKFLRQTKLDELPQLLNVLRGEMSIIGPRPTPENFYDLYKSQIPYYSIRHLILPGITGWAQIMLGYTKTIEQERQKFYLDIEYIKNIGFRYDIKILCYTLLSVCGIRKRVILNAGMEC